MAAFQASHNQTDLQREALPGLTNETGSNSLPGTLFHQNHGRHVKLVTAFGFYLHIQIYFLYCISLCAEPVTMAMLRSIVILLPLRKQLSQLFTSHFWKETFSTETSEPHE